MKIISSQTGYQLIASGNIPKLTLSYIKKNVVDKDVWSDLFLTTGKDKLRVAIIRHLSGLGGNVTAQLMDKLEITDEMLASCRRKYPAY